MSELAYSCKHDEQSDRKNIKLKVLSSIYIIISLINYIYVFDNGLLKPSIHAVLMQQTTDKQTCTNKPKSVPTRDFTPSQRIVIHSNPSIHFSFRTNKPCLI